jgi:hypothetical protein
MDYYEELGVPPSAPAEEIRRAWRNLARLLHPDQQQDENLRVLAEAQMKRLNEICATLTDAAERRRYDQRLLAAPPPRPRVDPQKIRVLAEVLVCCVIAAFCLQRQSSPPPAAGPRQAPAVAIPVAAAPATVREAPRRKVRGVSRDPAPEPEPPLVLERVAPVAVEPPPKLSSAAPAVPPAIPLAAQPAPALNAPPEPEEKPPRGMAGAWFYAPQRPASGATVMYPPEFIEAFITESEETLHGRYRARYKVGDRPISGDVQFSFEGAKTDGCAVLSWVGPNGAAGEVRLKLLDEETLQVTWKASRLGSSMGLASGTAALTRRSHVP